MEVTTFESDRGAVQVTVPDTHAKLIEVAILTSDGDAVTVEVHTRADAFKLAGIVLGQIWKVRSEPDAVLA